MKKTKTKRKSKPANAKQKVALAKGQKILQIALKLQKEGGTRVIPAKTVYKKSITTYMTAAKKLVKSGVN